MEYREYLENKDFSESSIKSHQITVNRFTIWIKKQKLTISELTYNDIMAYINHLKSKRNKQRTIQLEIGKLKHYINYQKLEGYITSISISQLKIQGVKRQSLYDILKPEELEYIYQSYPSENHNLQDIPLTPIQKRNKVIIGLLIYQGINTTDLGNLRIEHIQLSRGTIEIPETKKSNPRKLKLEAHQAIELQHYILVEREQLLKLANKSAEQLIFSQGTGNKVYNLLFTLIQQLKQQHSEIKSAKQIRASVITNWLKVHNLRECQYRAGHRFVSSTESYKINDIESLQNDITQFSPSI
jgi:site-specific recombinase XerD